MPFDATDKNQQIKNASDICKIIGKLSLGDDWIIPAQQEGEGDGCMGLLCVSRFQKVLVTQDAKWLAIHITFEISHLFIPTSAKLSDQREQAAVDITLKNLHFTARAIDDQKKISEIGAASILDSKVSMHRGVNNDWTYKNWGEEQLKDLATALGLAYVDKATMLGTLNDALQSYSANVLSRIGAKIASTVQGQIAENIVVPGGGAVKVAVKTENWD